MPISNQPSKINKISTFIDFIPAELRQTKDWIIVYYAKNPVTDKLERQRLRVPKINNTSERLRFAKKTVVEINNQLLNGWSPYMNESGKNYKSWKDAIAEFKRNLEKQLKDNSLRSDTIRTYNSNLNLIDQFIIDNNIKITFALQYNKAFCLQYIDWIYIQRNNSPRTRNNHLIFLRLLGNYFVDRGILAENPTNGIRNLARQPKKRIYIPKEVRTQIINEADGWSNAFGVVCRTIYYCMIRNTELGKLKVKHININENSIFIPKEISKNKRDEIVSVPDDLKIILKNHIENSNPDHYLFSSNNFFTGEKIMPIRKIQNHWDKLKLKISFKNEYQFYSLKDTGITDLFLQGIPALKIRNQARHSSVSITELYTPRNMNCDEIIKNAKNKF